MELEEMKNIWENVDESQNIIPNQLSDFSLLEYKRKTNIFKSSEIMGLLFAYTLAGFVLYKFNAFDNWYLRWSGFVLIIYLLAMPLYTLYAIWKMKHIDLIKSNYYTLLEHFYASKNNLKKAEKISFIASPFLFVASVLILTKLLTNKNLFDLNFQFPAILLLVISFLIALIINLWAFKKREKELVSIKQLLEDEN